MHLQLNDEAGLSKVRVGTQVQTEAQLYDVQQQHRLKHLQ